MTEDHREESLVAYKKEEPRIEGVSNIFQYISLLSIICSVSVLVVCQLSAQGPGHIDRVSEPFLYLSFRKSHFVELAIYFYSVLFVAALVDVAYAGHLFVLS